MSIILTLALGAVLLALPQAVMATSHVAPTPAQTMITEPFIPQLRAVQMPALSRTVIGRGETVNIHMIIRNHHQDRITTPVCATLVTPVVRHLGCVPSVSLAHNETFSFNVFRQYLTPAGVHTVNFSYRDHLGVWRGILTPEGAMARAVFTVR
jgi:hypothetical protein